MAQAREYGLLGNNILSSGFDFDIEIRLGAGARLWRTALLQSIASAACTSPPPFPAVRDLGQPTVINNGDLANVPVIITRASWFNKIGTADPRNQVFASPGRSATRLVEVPMGTTLRGSSSTSVAASLTTRSSGGTDRWSGGVLTGYLPI